MIDALRRARAALPQNPERALGALLEAWRMSRSPRVADLVDRVSAVVTEGRPPLPSQSVKARTAAFLTLAARGDPADLGRLLQTPWPGTWKAALPVLEALRGFDDPRLAMALARLLDATPFDTWTSDNFYRVLFAKLDALADLRTLPLLEAGLSRNRSTYWRQGTRKREEAAVATLRRRFPQGAPPPTDEEAAELEAMERHFAGAVRSESAKREGETGFLADVFARPDDDGLRQVFADWLQERGDPRGEFLALQLARAAGRSDLRSARREAALERQHGKAWAGPLDRFLAAEGRVFERGFLGAGTLQLSDRRSYTPLVELPVGIDVPDWSTLRSLALRWDEASQPELVEKVLSLPGLTGLRRVAGLQEPAVAFLGGGPPRPPIEELEFEVGRGAWESSPEALEGSRGDLHRRRPAGPAPAWGGGAARRAGLAPRLAARPGAHPADAAWLGVAAGGAGPRGGGPGAAAGRVGVRGAALAGQGLLGVRAAPRLARPLDPARGPWRQDGPRGAHLLQDPEVAPGGRPHLAPGPPA